MRRRISALALVISLLLLFATVVLWVWSSQHDFDWRREQSDVDGSGMSARAHWVNVYRGRILLELKSGRWRGQNFLDIGQSVQFFLSTPFVQLRRGHISQPTPPEWRDFDLSIRSETKAEGSFTATYRWVLLVLPMWFLALVLAIPSAFALRRRWRQRHRRPTGSCISCGYSLTDNTSGTCPECGTVIPKPTNKESPQPA